AQASLRHAARSLQGGDRLQALRGLERHRPQPRLHRPRPCATKATRGGSLATTGDVFVQGREALMTVRGGFLAVVSAIVAFTLVGDGGLWCFFVAASLAALSAPYLVAAGAGVVSGRSWRRAIRSVSLRRMSLRVARDDGADGAEAKGDRCSRVHDACCWT